MESWKGTRDGRLEEVEKRRKRWKKRRGGEAGGEVKPDETRLGPTGLLSDSLAPLQGPHCRRQQRTQVCGRGWEWGFCGFQLR